MELYFADVDEIWDEISLTPVDFEEVGDVILVTGRVWARGSGRVVDSSTGWLFKVRDGRIVWARVFESATEARRPPPPPEAEARVYKSFTTASVAARCACQLLAPRDREFFDLFEEAGGNILRAADLLDRMLRAYPDRGADLARDILICEQDGDRITHDIIRRLNETFVTPIDREDIYALASALDDIVDYTEEVADYLGLYKIEAPMEQSQRLAHVLLDCARQIARGDARGCAASRTSATTRSRSTGSRTTATASRARRSPRCSTTASTRWS